MGWNVLAAGVCSHDERSRGAEGGDPGCHARAVCSNHRRRPTRTGITAKPLCTRCHGPWRGARHVSWRLRPADTADRWPCTIAGDWLWYTASAPFACQLARQYYKPRRQPRPAGGVPGEPVLLAVRSWQRSAWSRCGGSGRVSVPGGAHRHATTRVEPPVGSDAHAAAPCGCWWR